MKIKTTVLLVTAALTLSACGGRFSDSGWNPLGWFSGGDRGARTLEPEGGYDQASSDPRQGIAAITGAHWELLNEGRLLVVTGLAPTKGYWEAELISEVPAPTGRLVPGPDGVLRLRFVIWPPPSESAAARMPANAATDTITTAITVSNATLARLSQVVITGATNSISIRR